jgi:capsular polysaccharide transport system permease protein
LKTTLRKKDGLTRLSNWQIQWRVVDALVYRELRTRVSMVRGGLLGALIQPVGLVLLWVGFFASINWHRGGNLNVVLYLTSGLLLFAVFAQIANRSLNAMEANEALLFYKPVKPIDTVIARTICETGLYAICMLIMLVGTWFFLDQIVMEDFGLFVFTYLLMVIYGFCLGLIFMVVGHLYPTASQTILWLPRVLWLISAIQFRYWYLPPWTHFAFQLNPLTHCIELNRRAMTSDYFTPDANLNYAILWAVILLTLSLWIYRNNERRLLTL